jgi:hypothetical protein
VGEGPGEAQGEDVMEIYGRSAAGTREMLVVVGLATAGLVAAAAVTLAPYAVAHTPAGPVPIVEISAPNAPLP